MQSPYVQERLQALEVVDLKLCSILQEASQVVSTFSEIKKGNQQMKPQFNRHVSQLYTDLEFVSKELRQEIKYLDENMGKRLLPINNVNKKGIHQDDDKLKEQIEIMEHVLE
ncbi:mediator of RNA polymerase II transcription subunit 11 [Monosporozyma unispora]|nr:Mediator of RNA polymerase II transcription subunit 11 [Kazachstania unispora]